MAFGHSGRFAPPRRDLRAVESRAKIAEEGGAEQTDMLHGSINHVSVTVSDLPLAMRFLALLEFLGFGVGAIFHDERSGHDLTPGSRAGRRDPGRNH
jgi:hypothetical protein